MTSPIAAILERFDAVESDLLSWRGRVGDPAIRDALESWERDLGALGFHLGDHSDQRPILALIGGTGTGKSTLSNRLLGEEVSATSFRRTFTSGPILFHHSTQTFPSDWLGLPHHSAEPHQFPVKGNPEFLLIGVRENGFLDRISMVDTPDVDGDAEAHFQLANRVFRWSDAILFVVTPEKYQMTELLPFYRLALRYEIPAQFVMNKCESDEVVADFQGQIEKRGFEHSSIFAIPRDDSTYEPPTDRDLPSLRAALTELQPPLGQDLTQGRKHRVKDTILSLEDRILAPLRNDLATVERLRESLDNFVASGPQVDVSPMTAELQRRMQAKSILYLMGPKRILERAKKVSSTILRQVTSPSSWFTASGGKKSQEGETIEVAVLPDFHSLLVDQFRIGQANIRDILEANPRAKIWMEASREEYEQSWIDPEEAGQIIDQEIASLNDWLKERWQATPRDTKTLLHFLHYIPGGKKVVEWSEASPYLLILVMAAYNSFFGPIDLLVIGGYSLATWLGEKLSNEVTSRARMANQAIYRRFERLMRIQVEKQKQWLEVQVPPRSSIESVEGELDTLARILEMN